MSLIPTSYTGCRYSDFFNQDAYPCNSNSQPAFLVFKSSDYRSNNGIVHFLSYYQRCVVQGRHLPIHAATQRRKATPLLQLLQTAIYLLTACYPGEIPSFKLFESDKTLAFLDVGPLSKGHAVNAFLPKRSLQIANITTFIQLVIPKFHGAKLADIPDDQLSEILVTCPCCSVALVFVIPTNQICHPTAYSQEAGDSFWSNRLQHSSEQRNHCSPAGASCKSDCIVFFRFQDECKANLE